MRHRTLELAAELKSTYLIQQRGSKPSTRTLSLCRNGANPKDDAFFKVMQESKIIIVPSYRRIAGVEDRISSLTSDFSLLDSC